MEQKWLGNTNINEQVSKCSFDDAKRVNYFEGKPINRSEVDAIVKKFKNGMETEMNEVTREMIYRVELR